MPVTHQTPVNPYDGNGVTTVFAYQFKTLAAADLQVTVNGTVQTLTTHYSVSGVGVDVGGNVTMVTPPASGTANVVIRRNMAYSRSNDYQNNGDLPANTLDDDVDRPILMIQQIVADQLRTIKLPAGTTTDQVLTESATARALRLLGFDSSGNAALFAASAVDLTLVSAFMATLLDDTTAAAARTTLGAAASAGYTSTGDIVMSGNSAIEEARANITQHATTMDFWAGPNVLDGAGAAVTITACVNAPQAGARRKFYPLAGTVLTHGATFDIDGNISQTATAGDCWEFVAKTVSTYDVHVTKEDGTAVGGAASTAEIKTGTEPAKTIAPDKLLAAIGFSARFNSGNLTITSGGALTVAHSLGREPIILQVWLKCLTAEGGYSIGDKVLANISVSNSAVDNKGVSIVPDSTNLNVRFGSSATVFVAPNKTTGAGFDVTNANWALVLDAFA